MAPLTGEHVHPAARKGLQITQQGHRLHGQGHHMGQAVFLVFLGALHLGAGDRPQCPVQVEFCPLHRPQVAGALVQQRGQLQGNPYQWPALVCPDSPHQFAKPGRFGDRCKVPFDPGCQPGLQALGNVPVLGRGHGQPVFEHLPRRVQDSPGRFHCAPFLYLFDGLHQFHGVNLGHQLGTDSGEQVFFQIAPGSRGVVLTPARFLHSEPSQGNRLEGVAVRVAGLQLFQLPCLDWINPLPLQCLCSVTGFAGRCNRDSRVRPQRHAPLFAVLVGFPKPAF